MTVKATGMNKTKEDAVTHFPETSSVSQVLGHWRNLLAGFLNDNAANITPSIQRFVQVIHRAPQQASGWKPLCRLRKWTLVYFIAQFSSIWK